MPAAQFTSCAVKCAIYKWYEFTHAQTIKPKGQRGKFIKHVYAGELAVVGVLMQEGPSEPNPALQFALRMGPDAAGQQQPADGQSMQVDTLLPRPNEGGHRPYIHYVGSLTTPPCSEAVQWFVMTDTVTIPSSQVVAFQEYADKANPGLRANSRPLQPLMGRSLDYQYL